MTTERTNLYIDAEVLAWVKERAKVERRSLSGQVEWLLRQAKEMTTAGNRPPSPKNPRQI